MTIFSNKIKNFPVFNISVDHKGKCKSCAFIKFIKIFLNITIFFPVYTFDLFFFLSLFYYFFGFFFQIFFRIFILIFFRFFFRIIIRIFFGIVSWNFILKKFFIIIFFEIIIILWNFKFLFKMRAKIKRNHKEPYIRHQFLSNVNICLF